MSVEFCRRTSAYPVIPYNDRKTLIYTKVQFHLWKVQMLFFTSGQWNFISGHEAPTSLQAFDHSCTFYLVQVLSFTPTRYGNLAGQNSNQKGRTPTNKTRIPTRETGPSTCEVRNNLAFISALTAIGYHDDVQQRVLRLCENAHRSLMDNPNKPANSLRIAPWNIYEVNHRKRKVEEMVHRHNPDVFATQ